MSFRDPIFLLPNQRPNEHVVFFLRRHWIRFAPHLVILIFTVILPLPVALFVPGLLDEVANQTPTGILAVMATGTLYLFAALIFLHAWVDYYLDTWIVTNLRIISVEQQRLFSRVVAELQLENIQDVTVEVQGVMPTMFRFGDIDIQTAAETPRFHFDDIPDPYNVARTIMDLHDKVKSGLVEGTPPNVADTANRA